MFPIVCCYAPSSPPDTKSNAHEDNEPDKKGISSIGSDDTSRCSIVRKRVGANDLVLKVLDGRCSINSFLRPHRIRGEGIKEGMNTPRDKHGVVGHKHEAACDTGDTNSTKPSIKPAEDANVAALEKLAQANLKDGERDSHDEQSKKVWDKERTASIFEREGREPPHVTETTIKRSGRKRQV